MPLAVAFSPGDLVGKADSTPLVVALMNSSLSPVPQKYELGL